MAKETPAPAANSVRLPFGASFLLTLLRAGVGWHFLYEGLVKILDRPWTSADYLRAATGPLAPWYHKLIADTAYIKYVDYANIGGLLAIGAALMLGLFTRTAAFFGILLLAAYYLAYPPFPGMAESGVSEGHYLVINKNLVELLALLVILAMPAAKYGIDGLLAARKTLRKAAADEALAKDEKSDKPAKDAPPADVGRRHMLIGLAGLPLVGGFVIALMKHRGWMSHEERALKDHIRVDARSGATIKKFDFSATPDDVKGKQPPMARIGNVQISRMIMGGNLMGGWAHARDLIYVDKLVKAYHHQKKIYETFALAEQCGINAIITNPVLCEVIQQYKIDMRGKIKFISDCGGTTVLEGAQRSIDNGACACYFHGGEADSHVAKGQFDEIAKVLELIRKNGLPAGIAAHNLKTVTECVAKGLVPDFWMKTLHRHNYPSMQMTGHDNCFCDDPDGTVAFMATQKQPWIAFKLLAAGALQPAPSFEYAYANGADFICVGMYDFQIVEDVRIAHEVMALKTVQERKRAWSAV